MLGGFIRHLLGARKDAIDGQWLAATIALHKQGAYADVIFRCEAALAR